MTRAEATAEVFWTAFRSLAPDARAEVLARLVRDRALRRDLMDAAVVEERRSEPARPVQEYLTARARRPRR
ncbi:MAG TPA: hypothetical protein VGQ83_13265 [Polyangia bacterium]|jgi:hypothetical protein